MNKKMLLAIVDGLITREGESQYDYSIEYIEGEDKIQTLRDAINLLPD